MKDVRENGITSLSYDEMESSDRERSQILDIVGEELDGQIMASSSANRRRSAMVRDSR